MVNCATYVAPTMEEARKILPIIKHSDLVGGRGLARLDSEWIVKGVRQYNKELEKLLRSDEEYLAALPIGDPETVTERLAQYQDAGIDHFSFFTSIGQDQRDILRSMELTATQILPALRKRELQRSMTPAAVQAGPKR
jgi:alkanesulfonate monooxygenase SsuD/methylene tetrahydromethanopterin reductase-like flavin-dependent oxidoreductase (luciferase family)